MSEKSTVRCITPRCIDDVAKYGEHYHSVYNREPSIEPDGATHLCDRCGARSIGGVWEHRCKGCGTRVEPGALVGLFVPHLCITCLQAKRAEQRARGAVCLACRRVFADCCC